MGTDEMKTIAIIVIIMLMLQLATALPAAEKNQANAQPTNSQNDVSAMYGSSNSGHSELPRVSTSGNNVYVVWLDNTLGSRDIFLRRSTDGGNTFEARIIDLSKNNVEAGGGASNPKITTLADNVYVVWENTPKNNGQIYFSKSNDGGNSFSNPVNLGNNTGFSGNPQIVVSKKNYLYIVWHDAGNDIIFRRSTDGGNTFDKSINLNNNITLLSLQPQLAVSDNNDVYVAWIRTHPSIQEMQQQQQYLPYYDIAFKKSIDNGETFEDKSINLVNNSTGFAKHLRLVVYQTNVYATWTNGTAVSDNDFLTDIVFTKSLDEGKTFEKAININNYTGWSFDPEIAVIGNNVYATWVETSHGKNGQIMLRKSLDEGKTFENKIINLSNNTEEDSFDQSIIITTPAAAQSENNVNNIYVVWNANKTNDGNEDIYLRRSTDGGNTFDNTINLSNNSWSNDWRSDQSSAEHPQISFSKSDNKVYVVWDANTTANSKDVFFKHVTTTTSTSAALSYDNYSNNKSAPHFNEVDKAISVSKNPYKGTIVSTGSGTAPGTSAVSPKIAIIKPTFTAAAYDRAFYVFYKLNADMAFGTNITKHIGLLSNTVTNKTTSKTAHSMSSEDAIHYLEHHIKWLMPKSNITILADQDVHNGYIFNKQQERNITRHNAYDIIILGHQEYVTQKEYDNLRQFVRSGGTIIMLDSNIFYAEVKYDANTQTITLVKGHGWAFNGISAWKSIDERWQEETSDWVGSNHLCYRCDVIFDNNPFGYEHREEQYMSNPKGKILLDYNASVISPENISSIDNSSNNNILTYRGEPNDSSENEITKVKIATYELDFGKGKVVSLGLYADDIIDDDKFNKFLDSVLFRYAINYTMKSEDSPLQ